jgi:hypothetical protein
MSNDALVLFVACAAIAFIALAIYLIVLWL